MKPVYLSTDASQGIYLVPDAVADDLDSYCLRFLSWVRSDPDAQQKYAVEVDGRTALAYVPETAFIDWLNTVVFPEAHAGAVPAAADWDMAEKNDVPWFDF